MCLSLFAGKVCSLEFGAGVIEAGRDYSLRRQTRSREANGKKESACFVRNDGLVGVRNEAWCGQLWRACALCGMRRDVGNGDRACARCLPGQWLEIIGEVASCGIERVDQGCGDFRVCTRAFGAVLRQAASMARCSVALLTDFRWTVVLPFRPQAPAAGMKAFGSSFISSACCSGVSLTMPQDLSG